MQTSSSGGSVDGKPFAEGYILESPPPGSKIRGAV